MNESIHAVWRLTIAAFAATLLGVTLAAPRAVAAEAATAESLDAGCDLLAAKVLAVIQAEGLPQTVAVGAFSAAARLESSGGVGLAHRVKQALQAKGLATQADGAVQLSGKFRDSLESRAAAAGSEGQAVALRIEYLIEDARDNELVRGVINAFGDAPLEIGGGTADLRGAPDSDYGDRFRGRQQAIQASFERPQAFVVGNETRPRPASPFGLEVRVDAGGVRGGNPRTPQIRGGRSFVALSKGDEYRVRLRNGTGETVLVSLTIDGLDAFTFSEDPGDKGRKVHFVLEPNAVYEVPGWYVNKNLSHAFRITDYGRSEAVKMLGSGAAVGQITATFYAVAPRTYTVSARVPEDDRLGTERGREIATDYETVRLNADEPLATVTVRYEKSP